MEKAVSLKHRIKGKENAAVPTLDNAANGILKLFMDHIHPENTRNNILTTHKIGPSYTQYFVPVIVYLTDLLTDIETTEDNIDGLNNAFSNVLYLSAPRLAHVTERKPNSEDNHYHACTDCQDTVDISLCKETFNYFHDNEFLENIH